MLLSRTIYLTAFVALLLVGCQTNNEDDAVSAEVADSLAIVDTMAAPFAAGDPGPEPVLATETGEATFYADMLDRKRTASGETLDQSKLVAAHRQFPFGTVVRVTNLRNEKSVDVRIIDRGPFGAPKVAKEKVIDLSRRAATELGIVQQGRAVVRVEVLSFGDGYTES